MSGFEFAAKSIADLRTAERDAARLARKALYVVAVECANGTWCELDAETFEHARTLADNWVDVMSARGCSVWRVRDDGKLVGGSGGRPLYLTVEKHTWTE